MRPNHSNIFLVAFAFLMLATLSAPLSAPAQTQPPVKAPPRPATGFNPYSPLDSTKIRKLYMDGEFEAAIEILETGLRERRPFSHNDSVFIYKHLGVMYAARYETREKGKFFMHQLLMTEPTAKIMDMYASDMIYMIFKNIQDEFESNRMRLDRAEDLVRGNSQTEPPHPLRDSSASATLKPNSGSKTWVWVGATAAVVGAGIGAYFLLAHEPKTTTTHSQF